MHGGAIRGAATTSQLSLLAGLLLALCAGPARADIYTFIDKDGVVHFTDQPRPGGKWRRIYKSGPGKASTTRGTESSRRPARDRSPSRYARYDQHIQEACALYHIPEPLVRAVIQVESDYDPGVVSRVGAQGLMQLMPSISSAMGVRQVFDPRENIFGGTRLLRILANRFDGDLVLTLAAYHAGTGAVRKYQGVPPYQTTRQYIRWVLKQYYRFRRKSQKAASQAPAPPAEKKRVTRPSGPTYKL